MKDFGRGQQWAAERAEDVKSLKMRWLSLERRKAKGALKHVYEAWKTGDALWAPRLPELSVGLLAGEELRCHGANAPSRHMLQLQACQIFLPSSNPSIPPR